MAQSQLWSLESLLGFSVLFVRVVNLLSWPWKLYIHACVKPFVGSLTLCDQNQFFVKPSSFFLDVFLWCGYVVA